MSADLQAKSGEFGFIAYRGKWCFKLRRNFTLLFIAYFIASYTYVIGNFKQYVNIKIFNFEVVKTLENMKENSPKIHRKFPLVDTKTFPFALCCL